MVSRNLAEKVRVSLPKCLNFEKILAFRIFLVKDISFNWRFLGEFSYFWL